MTSCWLKRVVTVACRSLVITLVLCCLSSVTWAQQSSALRAVYGRGVHAYFSGNTFQAEQYFTQVIQAGSKDPRPYYFRAMVRLQRGDQGGSQSDMRIGAAYEASNPGLQNAIGLSIQRLQGPGRRTLEKFRRQARLDRVQQRTQRVQQRYEQIEQRAPVVIRGAVPVPLGQQVQPPPPVLAPGPAASSMPAPVTPTTPAPITQTPVPTLAAPEPAVPSVAPPAAQPDPFGAGSGTREGGAVAPGPAPVTTPDDDPFGTVEAPAASEDTAAPAEEDPFGTLPSPSNEADPFGASEPEEAAVEEDSFGGSDSTTDSSEAEDDPFGESTAPTESSEADEDPFGGSSDAPAEPTEADDDIFGESTESADSSSAEEDPFGESVEEEAGSGSSGEEEATESDDFDPFGDSTAADDEDPFGESTETESAEESEEAPAEDSSDTPADTESDDEDPFGPFGATPAPSSTDAFAAEPAAPAATGPPAMKPDQLFFALGRWLGSRSTIVKNDITSDAALAPASFELGPSAAEQPEEEATPADPLDDDPFGGF